MTSAPVSAQADKTRPAWLEFESPYGAPWHEVIEHADWIQAYTDAPPFEQASRLGFFALRRPFARVPRVLSRGARPALDSALFRLMDAGPEQLLTELARVSSEEATAALVRLAPGRREGGDAKEYASPAALSDAEAVGLLSALLSPAADPLRARLLLAASRATRRRFGRKRQLYAPIYLSNACTNRCNYCGFRHDNDIERTTLDAEQVRAEAGVLLGRGFDSVLLLTGEAPRVASLDYLEAMTREVARDFSHVGIEVFPLEREGYARLREAGVDSVTVYQETYDPLTYRRVHEAGRKRDMLHRLMTPERVLEAGIERLGLGFLLGLAPWRFEALALGLHARALLQLFPNAKLSVSFPRLRAAVGATPPEFEVDDAALVHVMSVLRLWLPEAELVLSTREPAGLRDALTPLLVTRLSAGSSTEPGGYSRSSARGSAPPALAQFSLSDERPVEQVRARLVRRGLVPCG
ncbi:MAG TPA: radical SAM protein [Polyangiaceae bacterium]|nr:radical SAM protein [Polyangiaceae bacterium]